MKRLAVSVALLALTVAPNRAHAIRPFVTDDARVVGHKLAQLETWVLVDGIALDHSVLGAIGPTRWLEVTLGFVQGGIYTGPDKGYSIAGPIGQAKALLFPARNNSWPGVAVAAGTLAPLGYGGFKPPGWGGFGYIAVTESLCEEWLLLHGNIGVTAGDEGDSISSIGTEGQGRVRALMTGGFGFQARVVAGLHAMGEAYYGDPYDPRFAFPAGQLGFRYIFSDHVQVDGTFGTTLTQVRTGEHEEFEQWGTLGLRLVTPELW